MPGKLPGPVDDMDSRWSSTEKAQTSAMLKYSFVGGRDTVGRDVRKFVDRTGLDEVFVVSAIYEHTARLRSYELLRDADLAD
jgi:alkanesulfonate monooxygenase SsuD/methylene tetrahydromethanopterin reductase-like flavin-dependent oxidoreductase (luciferase family)